MVDLAGSEKINQTGATGSTLNEGININKSLSALGNCISALADKCSGKNKNAFIPYRNSKLTFIMKESLGGNSKTVMIAAVSPASINYIESLGTLRYANRAKQIKTQAIVNEDPNEKVIKQLKAQVAELENQLRLAKQGIDPNKQVDTAQPSEEAEKLRKELEESQELIKKLQMSSEEKEELTKKMAESRATVLHDAGLTTSGFDRHKIPHLVNLNEDPLMSDSLLYPLNCPGVTTLGKKAQQGSSNKVDIQLGGLGLAEKHCSFVVEGSGSDIDIYRAYLIPGDGTSFVNGKEVREKTQLSQGYRIILGNNHIFRFNHPQEAAKLKREGGGTANVVDWTFAQKELAEAQGQAIEIEKSKVEKEMQEKLQAKLQEIEKEKQEQQAKLDRERLEMERNANELREKVEAQERLLQEQMQSSKEKDTKALAEMQEQLRAQQEQAQREMEKQKRELEEKQKELEIQLSKQKQEFDAQVQEQRKQHEERTLLEERVSKLIPMVNEANAISKELQKKLTFELKLIRDTSNSQTKEQYKLGVMVNDKESESTIMWLEDKFIDRIYLMREVWEYFLQCQEHGTVFNILDTPNFQIDPFEDEEAMNQHELVGTSRFYLKSLAHQIEFDTYTPILDYRGKNEGELKVAIIPCDEKGRVADDDDDDVDIAMYNDPATELVGQPMHFYIKIIHARGLQKKLCRDVFVRYKFFVDRDFTETKSCPGESMNPEINFSKRYDIPAATKDLVHYLQNNMLVLEVYAMRQAKESTKPKAASSAETIEDLKKKIEDLTREKERVEQERDQVIQDLNITADEKVELVKANTELVGKLKVLEVGVKSPTDKGDQLNRLSTQLGDQISHLQLELSKQQQHEKDALQEREKQIVELQKQVKQKEQELSSHSKNQNTENIVAEKERQIEDLKRQVERKEEEIRNQRQQHAALQHAQSQQSSPPPQQSVQQHSPQPNHEAEKQIGELKKQLQQKDKQMTDLAKNNSVEVEELRRKLKALENQKTEKSKACSLQ